MSTLVLFLLATAMFVNYRNTESFIEDQLLSNAENTASSLGVAIGNLNDDKIMAETLINAVFDSGYYESIVWTDIDGNIIYKDSEPLRVHGVPQWFIDHVHLRSTEASVPLSKDWRLVGYLKVMGHRGHAYEQIWYAFKEMIAGFVVLGLFALIGIYLLLKIVLSPLKRVREQAEAVIQRRFIFQELPKTKEMRDVVTAMNSLVKKVKWIYEKEAKAIADYNRLLYEDRETGYYNRNYFRMKLQEYLHLSDHFSHGYVLAFEIHEYTKLLERKGRNHIHDAIVKLRDVIEEECCSPFIEAVRCRTREDDIMIILPASRKEDVEKFARTICERYNEYERVDCAYIDYKERDSLSMILERIDSGLMIAASDTQKAVHIYCDGEDKIPILSHNEWIKKVYEAMENHDFIPVLQPVVSKNGKIVQQELLLRLKYEGKIVNAGLFMPIVAGVKMLSDLDTYVLERIGALQLSVPLSVNMTYDFIAKSANLQRISSLSEGWRRNGSDVIFELHNSTVASDPETSKAFVQHIHAEGWQLGIDHFTVGAYDLHLLEILKPAYLKLNAAYLLSLIEGEKSNHSNASLFTITELLEIDLIATSVDSKDTATRLLEKGIVHMQGFWIAEPREGDYHE